MAATRRLLAGLSVAIGVLASAPDVFACDCHDGGPVCSAFWDTPVVFAGRVEAVTPIGFATRNGPSHRVRFRVTEALRGTSAQQIELFNYPDNCHLPFAPGEDWLIYAFPRRDGAGLTTFTCSRSRPLRYAREDLAFARAAYSNHPEKGRIFGQLAYQAQTGSIPVPGATLHFSSGPFTQLSASTDASGRYEAWLHAGSYRVSAALPPGMVMRVEELELPDTRACVEATLWAEFHGQVSGRVVTVVGEPVANLTVELIGVTDWDPAVYRPRALTDSAGRFDVSVKPGTYQSGVLIGAHRRTHTAEPRFFVASGTTMRSAGGRLDVAGGTRHTVGDLVLPELTRVAQITGVVVRRDGRPAADVSVAIKADLDTGDFPWTTLRTNERGEFSIGLVVGLRYRFVAEAGSATGRSLMTTLDPAKTTRVRLVVP